MRSFKTYSLLGSLSLTLCCAQAATAQVKPSALFSDHMVLQSGMTAPVWGTAEPGERLKVVAVKGFRVTVRPLSKEEAKKPKS